MRLDPEKILSLLDKEGALSRTLKGFESREPQRRMACNVAEAYNENAVSLIEAGTGTGKSIAYLIPAMLWSLQQHERTVISTNTITLQEQLIHKDIPALTKALGLEIKAALVKGMNNYACLRKIQDAKEEIYQMSPQEQGEFRTIEAWAERTQEGSKSSLPLAPSPATWERVSAESDTCSHAQCPYYQRCFFFQARRQAEEAQILVANHHLLFADLSVRAETANYNNSAVLPLYSRIILDEAHHIEDVATDFFGSQVSKLGILRTLNKLTSDKQNQGKLASLRDRLQQYFPHATEKEVRALLSRLQIDFFDLHRDVRLRTQETFQTIEDFVFHLSGTEDREKKLRLLPAHQKHVDWINGILPAAKSLIGAIQRYVQALMSFESDLKALANEKFQESTKALRADIEAFSLRLSRQAELLEQCILTDSLPEKVRWIEVHPLKTVTNVTLIDADLDISSIMASSLFQKFSTTVLCSATLATNQQFGFIRERLGILSEKLEGKKILENIYESPFDYAKQSLLAVPSDLPSPLDATFLTASSEQIWQAIQASQGGVFILFTAYGAMQKSYEILQKRLKEHRFHAFMQGQADRQALLNQFKTSPRGVLFGTDSFWEGVDVAGEALRCVVIVKLPFKVPTEPIIQARTEAIQMRGGDPFFDYTLPSAIVKFKQGFGRLIRHNRDRGCIICLDNRLLTKGYGKQFLNSLPPCQCSFPSSINLKEEMRNFYRRTHHLIK